MKSIDRQEFERRLQINLDRYVKENDNFNEFLVQFIEQAGDYLNLQTISDYAKANNMSYNGVKNCRKIVEIFNTKFVIDNE